MQTRTLPRPFSLRAAVLASLASVLLIGTITAQSSAAEHLRRPATAPSALSLLVIHDSGAINLTTARTITFTQIGGARLHDQHGTTTSLPDGAFAVLVQSLVTLVERAGGAGKVRTGRCLKSVSYAHAVWLSLGGQRSGDLTCLASDARPVDQGVERDTLNLEQRVVRLAVAQSVRG